MSMVRKMPGISEFTQSFFQDSSKAWKKNKIRYDQATYIYKKKVFPMDTECPPPPPQSLASQKQTEKELQKRRRIDEFAPPRVRTSPRLHAIHQKETYTM